MSQLQTLKHFHRLFYCVNLISLIVVVYKGKEMVGVVKQVAECVEGDPKVVESELVRKLRTQVGKKINLR